MSWVYTDLKIYEVGIWHIPRYNPEINHVHKMHFVVTLHNIYKGILHEYFKPVTSTAGNAKKTSNNNELDIQILAVQIRKLSQFSFPISISFKLSLPNLSL
jgi:hypothetical protein